MWGLLTDINLMCCTIKTTSNTVQWHISLDCHYLLISHVYILPSKPDVTSKPSRGENSMFFTQLEWPWRVRIWDFKLRASHSATVLSSLHVAKTRESKNLKDTIHKTVLEYFHYCLNKFLTIPPICYRTFLQLTIFQVIQRFFNVTESEGASTSKQLYHCTLCCTSLRS
jgi:hypothetical protein